MVFLSVNNWSFASLGFLERPVCTSVNNVSLCRWSCSSSVSIPLDIFHIRDKHVIRLKFLTSFSFSLTFIITADLLMVSQSVISFISKYNCNCVAILLCKLKMSLSSIFAVNLVQDPFSSSLSVIVSSIYQWL